MNTIRSLLRFLMRLAVSEKIIMMLFIMGCASMIMVHMSYGKTMQMIVSQHDFKNIFTAQEIPCIIGSFFTLVCVCIIGSTCFWWIFQEFFKDETIVFFLMKPFNAPLAGYALTVSGFLLIGAFIFCMESIFTVITFAHTRTVPLYYLLINGGVLWYTGILCFLYFCYFYTLWKSPASILLSLMIAGLGFMNMRLSSIEVPGVFLNFSLLLAQSLIPPIDRLFTVAVLKYDGNPSSVIIQSLPIFFLLYILSLKNITETYENKRKR